MADTAQIGLFETTFKLPCRHFNLVYYIITRRFSVDIATVWIPMLIGKDTSLLYPLADLYISVSR